MAKKSEFSKEEMIRISEKILFAVMENKGISEIKVKEVILAAREKYFQQLEKHEDLLMFWTIKGNFFNNILVKNGIDIGYLQIEINPKQITGVIRVSSVKTTAAREIVSDKKILEAVRLKFFPNFSTESLKENKEKLLEMILLA